MLATIHLGACSVKIAAITEPTTQGEYIARDTAVLKSDP